MTAFFLTPERLAERWCLTTDTLRQWRWNGKGPLYLKIGGRILYRLQDIEEFEAQQLYQNTSQKNRSKK